MQGMEPSFHYLVQLSGGHKTRCEIIAHEVNLCYSRAYRIMCNYFTLPIVLTPLIDRRAWVRAVG
jgi:hypothetical protein